MNDLLCGCATRLSVRLHGSVSPERAFSCSDTLRRYAGKPASLSQAVPCAEYGRMWLLRQLVQRGVIQLTLRHRGKDRRLS